MRAVITSGAGGPDVLSIGEVPDPEPGPGEVLLEVAATAVNRADVMQRQGLYPPPPGVTDVIGLECSGVVAAVGQDVEGWSVGDHACALLAGGGYAERVAVPAGQLMPIPDGVDLVTAAALPEVSCTVWSNVFMVGHLQPGESFLAHGGAGGIGTCAIQLAKAYGARVLATCGSAEKAELCRSLGADVAINYRESDFVEEVGPDGVDVILDNMGANFPRNVRALATAGRLVIIGLQGGVTGELDIATLLGKRGAVVATSLRGRPAAEKAAICASVVEHVWPLVAEGSVRPIVHDVLPLDEVARAHELMEASSHSGKIILTLARGGGGGGTGDGAGTGTAET